MLIIRPNSLGDYHVDKPPWKAGSKLAPTSLSPAA